MSDYHSPANMKKDFSVGEALAGEEGWMDHGGGVVLRLGSARGVGEGEVGTRCQEYKAGDKRDAGHICDS